MTGRWLDPSGAAPNEPYVYPVMARSSVILATCGTDLIIR